jgi:hypothetical protein
MQVITPLRGTSQDETGRDRVARVSVQQRRYVDNGRDVGMTSTHAARRREDGIIRGASMVSRVCAVLLGLTVLLAVPVAAQTRSTTHGFMLGAHLFGVSLDPENGEQDDGGGFGLVFGWGFRNRLSLFLAASVAYLRGTEEGSTGDVLGEGDLGVRYTFGSSAARWRPFLTAALSGVTVSYENVEFDELGRVDVAVSGRAFTGGGGVQLFLGAPVALEAALVWSGGSFDEIKVNNVTVELADDDRIEFTTARLQIGIRYHFGRN